MKTSNQPFTRTTSRRNMSITLLAALFVALAALFAAPPQVAEACVPPDVTGPTCDLSETYPSWMADNAGLLSQRPLTQVVIPGAHDAGTARVTSVPLSAQNQDLEIVEQLNYGVRWFDMRFCKSGSHVVFCHGDVKTTTPERDTVDDINTWTRMPQHAKEILIFKWTNEGSGCSYFFTKLRDLLIPNTNQGEMLATVGELWDDPDQRRIIVDFKGTCAVYFGEHPEDRQYAWDNGIIEGEWGGSAFVSDTTNAMQKDLQNNYTTTTAKLHNLQTQTLLLINLYHGALHDGNNVLNTLESWWNNNTYGARGKVNLIWSDYVEFTKIVQRAIRMNKKTGPVISGAPRVGSPGGPPYFAGRWTNQDVHLNASCQVAADGTTLPVTWKSDRAWVENRDGALVATAGMGKVSINCTDAYGMRARTSVQIRIDKTPPTITASATKADGTPYVGGTWTNQTVTLHFTCADQANLSGLASCPADQVFSTDGTFTAAGTARDIAGNSTSAGVGSIKIDKTPPTASPGGPYTVNEGASMSLSASGSDTLSGIIHYAWDLDNNDSHETAGQNVTFSAAALDGPSSRTVGLRVTDLAGNQTVTQATVNVQNVAPTLSGVAGSTIDENGTATVSGNITDPGTADTFSLTIDWKDGGAPQAYTYPAGTTTFSEQHQYLDDNPSGTASDPYAVALSIQDDDGGVGTASTNVTVNNVDPVARIDELKDNAGVVLGTSDAVLQGLALTVSESYSDVGTRDTRTAVRDWGDGTVEALGAITGATSGSHIYAAAGTYTLMLTVTDDDTGVGVATRQIVVVTPAGATTEAIASLRTATSTSPTAATAIAAALVDLDGNNGGAANDGALDKLQSNDPNAALVLISKALQDLRAAEEADATLNFTALKQQLTLTAKSVAVDAINRAAAVASTKGEQKQVADAWTSVDQGQVLFMSGGDYVGAVAKFQDALQKALGVLAEDGV